MPVKTFRGLIAHGSQDTINLHTITGRTGYRLVRFDTIDQDPGTNTTESVVKVYKTKQTTINGTVNFSDMTLIAVAYFENNTSTNYGSWKQIIFDREIFNQNIYVTSNDNSGSSLAMNYFIELEQLKLDGNETAVATLKNIKNRG